MSRWRPVNPKPKKAVVTVRMDHATHHALTVLGHEERTSVQKLIAGWIDLAIGKNDAASGVLKLQRAIAKKGEGA